MVINLVRVAYDGKLHMRGAVARFESLENFEWGNGEGIQMIGDDFRGKGAGEEARR